MQDFILIGHTKKTYGVNGQLKVQVFDEYLDSFFQTEVVFIELQGQKIPYFIENISQQGTLMLQLEEVNEKETALKVMSKKLYLRAKDAIKKEEEGNLQYSHCIGFTIVDTEQGKIGVIEEVLEFPQQEIAMLNYQQKEVFIPLNEHFIKAIDTTNKVIKMTLPLGILEL